MLARNIALRNPGISTRDLNFAVQRTIDRIVFLRICEDRGIEPYGSLQGLTNGQNIYARLGEWFRRADQRYNSGLFYFDGERDRGEPPDEMTLGLAIDDKPLRDIIRNLYFPDSPYEFSVLPAEILGQVYEQFLGKVIRLTHGRAGQGRGEAGGPQGRRRLLHAGLHRRLHRAKTRSASCWPLSRRGPR